MSSNMSAYERVSQAKDRLETVRREMANYIEPVIPIPTFRLEDVLDKLSRSEIETVLDYLIFDLPEVVENNPLGQFMIPGMWFDILTASQQEQVVDYLSSQLLEDSGLVLTKYEAYGQNGGYRFEIAIKFPVASR